MLKLLQLRQILLTVLSFIVLAPRSHANLNTPIDSTTGIFDLIQSDEPLEVEIEVDLQALLNNRKTNDYLPAKLTFEDKNEKEQNWDIEVRVRGRYRRRVCNFPPLKLQFSKKDLKARGFQKFDDFKLVTHCVQGIESKEYVLREGLIYKLYEQLTEKSFRTQILKITYRDNKSNQKYKRYAVLIEDKKQVAKRLNSKHCGDCFGWTQDSLQAKNVDINALFQFMIANTDWSIPLARNLKIMRPKNGDKPFVVPYDFDFSGFVNAPYYIPHAELGIQHCRQRLFQGEAMSKNELNTTIVYFKEKKEALYNTVRTFDGLSKRAKRDIISFLNSFYTCINETKVVGEIHDATRKK